MFFELAHLKKNSVIHLKILQSGAGGCALYPFYSNIAGVGKLWPAGHV